ncbi:MAG: galactokinase [Clostridiales bacterium]|nr:galactokinase [Clostridiales bacterium]
MTTEEILSKVRDEGMNTFFAKMYGSENVASSRRRYEKVIDGYAKRFGDSEDVRLYSSPGRTELCGNHTDHNCGKILAGSINLDCVSLASANGTDIVNILSIEYGLDFSVNVKTLVASGDGGTVTLVEGIIDGFKQRGHEVGGFDAYVSSNVIAAAGISSSASFEMLICAIMNDLFNDGNLSITEYAQIGKFAENNYWNKSSGLLDQMACAAGGIINIDFRNDQNPAVSRVDIDFEKAGYEIVIVNTGKGHADLSAEYSSIPLEMRSVAKHFGKIVLAEITLDDVVDHLFSLRGEVGDRAVLRAIHFFNENKRVDEAMSALKDDNFDGFLAALKASGESSWQILQNCYCIDNPREQGIPMALALTKMFFDKKGRGVCRVHGGGFAGVIMAVVDLRDVDEYVDYMESKFMKGSTYRMMIRPYGAINVLNEMESK